MPRAILRAGVIYPVEPLPPEWKDGQEVMVEPIEDEERLSPEEVDRLFAELEEMVAQNDPEDLKRVEETLKQADEQAKAQMRREMGLP